MSWGLAPTLAYPRAVPTVMRGLKNSTRTHIADADVRPGLPTQFSYDRKLIVVRRVGGGPNDDDDTDYPVMQIACYAGTYLEASDMQSDVELEILGWPMTMVGSEPENMTLVDEAEIYVGEQEIPDIFPDERRVVATYQLGWRRQHRP